MPYELQAGQWTVAPPQALAHRLASAVIGLALLQQTLEHAVPGPYARGVFPTQDAAVQMRPAIQFEEIVLPVRPPRPAYLRRGQWATQNDATAALTSRIEMNFGEGWVDISEDVVSNGKCEWGIHGGGPRDRVASPGTLSFVLDNSSSNSGGLRGYYSPDHAGKRPGFQLSTPTRLVFNLPSVGDKVMWVGTIGRIVPKPGVSSPTAAVECVDWLEEASRAKLSGLSVQQNIQSDRLFKLLVAAVTTPPPGGVRVGAGSDIYAFALDSSQDENTRIIAEIAKAAYSEYGQAYVDAGVAVFEGRRRRGAERAVQFAMDEDEQIIAMPVTAHDRDQVINRTQVTVRPRRRDADNETVLFTLASALQIQRGTTVTINCPYRDPAQLAQRVGGIDMQPPDSTAGDYAFNTLANGTGANITAQLTVTAVFGGNSARVTISNRDPADGYIPPGGLKLRGRGLYDLEPIPLDEVDEDSIREYGENVQPYDMPYQSSIDNGLDLARFILHLHKDPATRATSVTFLANWTNYVAEKVLTLGISDLISITAATIGLDQAPFWINGWKLDIRQNGVVVVTWDLAPADATTYWLLGIDGRSEMGETTRLGYGFFSAGWILGESLLGTDTFL